MASRALVEAIKKGDFPAVRNIFAADPASLVSREDSASPVLTALYYGQTEIAEFLAPRADLDIFEAAASGQLQRLEELIAADPDITRPSTDGWTPLHLAAFFGRTDAARRLIDAGADLKAIAGNSTANTPLHAAIAGRGEEELVLRMLMAGADATVATAEGYTPLHVAASRGNQRMCDLLIRYRAQPAAKMNDGKTAADIAAERGHSELSAYLRQLETA
ncbi:MAG: ankyrin repeat domain-containing protein [Gemmatimonadota bacterium]|nr:ankyrin repeat domain-containing protein [Gemmatimonadota bacterium]